MIFITFLSSFISLKEIFDLIEALMASMESNTL